MQRMRETLLFNQEGTCNQHQSDCYVLINKIRCLYGIEGIVSDKPLSSLIRGSGVLQ